MILIPCPYCGSTDIVHQNHIRTNNPMRGVYFACMDCKAYGPDRPTLEEAATAWNQRFHLFPFRWGNNPQDDLNRIAETVLRAWPVEKNYAYADPVQGVEVIVRELEETKRKLEQFITGRNLDTA